MAVIAGVVARAPFLLDAITRPPVFIITGSHGSGKSEMVMKLAELLRAAGKTPGGISAAGFWENGLRSGFDLVNLSTGGGVPLCRRGPGGSIRAGEFRFFDEGLAAGLSALSSAGLADADIVFVDEVGFLELDGGGWAAPLSELLRGRKPLVLVVRDYLVERVTAHFGLTRSMVWEAGIVTAADALPELLPVINLKSSTTVPRIL